MKRTTVVSVVSKTRATVLGPTGPRQTGLRLNVIQARRGSRVDLQSSQKTAFDAIDGAEFGSAVAMADGVLCVGARSDSDNGVQSGAAYLYDASSGALIVKVLPNDGAAGDQFGCSVAIGGGLLVVGAFGDQHDGISSGSAYLFDAATGTQIAKLAPSDGAPGDEFGHSVGIENGVVVVGAKRDDDLGVDSGSVYIFDTSGAQIDKILAEDGSANDNFGGAVAIDGGIIAVGAHADWNGSMFLAGSAYTFGAGSGNQIDKLTPNNASANDFFGSAIDIDNGFVVVGAWAKSIFFDHSGAAYVFDVSDGSQVSYIVPEDGHDRDHFGNSVSISDGVVAIGAHQDGDNGMNAGSAYIYDAMTGGLVNKLLSSDGAQFDQFGSSIAIDQGLVAVGAIGASTIGGNSGAVYVFGDTAAQCVADLNLDGALDFLDISELLNSNPDLNGDGHFDFLDISMFLESYAGGCP